MDDVKYLECICDYLREETMPSIGAIRNKLDQLSYDVMSLLKDTQERIELRKDKVEF